MPTPSFDELLARARQIGEAEADRSRPSTGMLAAKGASQFVTNLLNAPVSERRSVGGYLSPSGEYQALDKPYTSGGNVLQTFVDRFRGGQPPVAPEGAFPVTPEEGSMFARQAALENIRGGFRVKTADLRAKAQQRVQGTRAAASTQPMVKEASDYVWALIGRDPESENLPLLTFGDADRMMRGKGIDTQAELKGLGYEISLFKDPLFGIPEDQRGRLQGKITEKNTKRAPGVRNYKTLKDALDDGKKAGDVVTINGEKIKLAP